MAPGSGSTETTSGVLPTRALILQVLEVTGRESALLSMVPTLSALLSGSSPLLVFVCWQVPLGCFSLSGELAHLAGKQHKVTTSASQAQSWLRQLHL